MISTFKKINFSLFFKFFIFLFFSSFLFFFFLSEEKFSNLYVLNVIENIGYLFNSNLTYTLHLFLLSLILFIALFGLAILN